MRKILLALAIIAALFAAISTACPLRAATWHRSPVLAEGVTCDEDALGCAGPANPEVIAAVKKRYPKADADAWAFDETTKNGKRRYSVTFFNDDGNHISCKLKLKPTRLGRCGIIHA